MRFSHRNWHEIWCAQQLVLFLLLFSAKSFPGDQIANSNQRLDDIDDTQYDNCAHFLLCFRSADASEIDRHKTMGIDAAFPSLQCREVLNYAVKFNRNAIWSVKKTSFYCMFIHTSFERALTSQLMYENPIWLILCLCLFDTWNNMRMVLCARTHI